MRFDPHIKAGALAGALCLAAAQAGAAVVFFNDATAFDAATQGEVFLTDTFDVDIPDADTIVLSPALGVTSTNTGGNRLAGVDNGVAGGVYNNAIDGNGDFASTQVTWSFDTPVTALSLQYSNLVEDLITVTVDGETRALRESADGDPAGGFFGFTTDTAVSQIVFANSSADASDVFAFDDLNVSVVPVPPALAMLLSGLFGLGWMARRRRA